MLNRPFQKCVKFHTNLFSQLLIKPFHYSWQWVSMNWKYLFNIIAFKCWKGLFRSVGNFIQIYCGSLSRNTVTTMCINELKIFVEYHSIQMLNRSFYSGPVSEVCEISNNFNEATCLETLSLLKSISELKIFVEYHSIQLLNKSFHLGLISAIFFRQLLIKHFHYYKYYSTANICWISYHSDVEQIFSFRASLRSVWNFIQIYSGNFLSKHFHY